MGPLRTRRQAEPTVRVTFWVTTDLVFPAPNVAMKLRWYVPVSTAFPEMVAVLSPLSTNERCFGSLPLFLILGTGVPDVVTTKENCVPAVVVAVSGLVKACGGTESCTAPMSQGVGRATPL